MLKQGREKAFTHLMELHTEVVAFFKDHNAELIKVLDVLKWVCELTYLADILSIMNKNNL